jgi:hypothetical protein
MLDALLSVMLVIKERIKRTMVEHRALAASPEHTRQELLKSNVICAFPGNRRLQYLVKPSAMIVQKDCTSPSKEQRNVLTASLVNTKQTPEPVNANIVNLEKHLLTSHEMMNAINVRKESTNRMKVPLLVYYAFLEDVN